MHNNLGNGAEDIGLVYMAARWYAPALGRFLSADTLIPDPTNPQSYNRYSYVENRSLVFTDPTGHRPSDGCETESCMSDQHTWGQNFVAQMAQKDDRFHTAVTALYEDYQTRFGDVIDVPQGSSVEYTLWQIAYQDTLTLDRVIREGGWLTNAVRNAFNGGYLDPLDIIEGSIGVILSISTGSDNADDQYGPLGATSSSEFGPNNWYRATYNSASESMLDHFERHPGPWRTPEEYTETAVAFYQDFWDLGKPHQLRGGGAGIKITTNDYFGIYTSDGRVVTFGIR